MSKMMSIPGLLLTVASVVAAAKNEKMVKFVTVLYRHGDRTPIKPYPTDPYRNESYWPVGFGQLTSRGKQMQFALGQYLRERYGDLLGDEYSEKSIYVRSSDIDRTLMSAQSNLAGLYPPKGDQVWRQGLAWQPIPVHTVPVEGDNMIASHADCPRLQEKILEVMESEEMKALNKKYEWVYQYLTEHSGEVVENITKLDYIYDTLFIEKVYNKTLPDWTEKVFPHEMQYLRDLSFTVSTWDHEMKRLRGGPLVDELVNSFRLVINGTVSWKMIMFSGHDTTLSALMNTMGIFDPVIAPPYASLLMFELLQSSKGDFFVQILYRNDSTKDPRVLTLPGCSPECPLEEFDRLTQPLRPNNWAKECQLPGYRDKTFEIMSLVAVMASLVLTLVLVISVIVFCYRKRLNFTLEQHAYVAVDQSEP